MEWISIKDRLPNKDQNVLGWISVEEQDGILTLLEFDNEKKSFIPIFGKLAPNSQVTHWMPLPKPPEEK